MTNWPHVAIRGLPRTVFNHCPVIMETKVVDWGPKPFRFINVWCSHPEFKKIVENAWKSDEFDGWFGYRVKEKLKRVKDELKKWNRESFGNIDNKVDKLKQEIHELDMIDDAFGIEEDEIVKRKESTANLFRSLNQRNNLYAQKAKIRWLNEGDVNSSFFHRAVNFRRKKNEILGLKLNGAWTEDVNLVKSGVRDHFQKQYCSPRCSRPAIAPEVFSRKISKDDNSMLIEQFS